MMNGNVLISGAGVTGLALAYWLDRAGFATTLIELAPAFRRGGQAVDIRGVALDVVEEMGLLEDARALRTRLKGMSTATRHNAPKNAPSVLAGSTATTSKFSAMTCASF
jgi:2-polyprenyl-6-methoxyphenol hydroxylase-like FAD-dependent oxidoreductase